MLDSGFWIFGWIWYNKPVTMISIISLVLSAIVGYLIAEYIGGAEEGGPAKIKSIRIKVKDYVLHVHHWLYASVALVVMPSDIGHKTVIEAFLVGVIVQGLTYKDFYKVVYRTS